MGRQPIGKAAMTAAERQRRRRRKLRQGRRFEIDKKHRAMAREREAERYIPTPPGITHWEHVPTVTADGSRRKVWAPVTKPLATCAANLDDDDVLVLLVSLAQVAVDRGIDPEEWVARAGEAERRAWAADPLGNNDGCVTVGGSLHRFAQRCAAGE